MSDNLNLSVAVAPIIPFRGVEDAMDRVKEELMSTTRDQVVHQATRIPWPAGGHVKVRMSGLPVKGSANCYQLTAAIRNWCEDTVVFEGKSYTRLPVHSIHIERDKDLITITAAMTRISEMQPMP